MPIGVIGAGLVTQAVHLPLLGRLAGRYRVVALAEPNPRAREEVAMRHGIPAAFTDHRELLDERAIEAVLVSSPNATHAEIVVDALTAGKHVLVEKPLCLTVDEGRRVIDARDRAGLVVQVGYMKRFDPAVEALLDELPATWSPLHIATATFDPGMRAAFGPPGLEAAADFGARADAFLGALIHDVNLVHAVLERCGVEVERVADAWDDDAGTGAGGTIVLDGGARWTAAWLGLPGAGTFREHVVLYGADGVRELEFPAPYLLHAETVFRYLRASSQGSIATTRASWQEAYERQLIHFHECLAGTTDCRTPPEHALTDIRLAVQLLEASVSEVRA